MKPRRGYTLLEVLVVIFLISIVMSLLVMAVQKTRAASSRLQCANNLRQIGLALHQFHDLHGRFPPAYSQNNPNDQFGSLSWRIRITPFLDQSAYWQETQREF